MEAFPGPGTCRILDYDTDLFPFRPVVEAVTGVEPLENAQGAAEVDPHHCYQSTHIHQRFYQNFRGPPTLLSTSHRRFVRWLKDRFGIPDGGLVFQRVPTLRIHPVGGKAVGTWHRDSLYGHAAGEINVWVPLTRAEGSSALHIKVGDRHAPLDVTHGQALLFDGVTLLHGNVVNTTDAARVSFDFRIARREGFMPSGQLSACAQRRLEVGDYFEVM